MIRQSTIPLVLHKIVQDGAGRQFEDIEISMFHKILETCQGRCLSLDKVNICQRLPGKSFLLTFDDGFSSDYESVFPLLQQMDCLATFFLTTDNVGANGFVSWAQVRELHDAGMTIGSHSRTHPDMRCLTLSRQREELLSSRLCLEDKLGSAVTAFSFPFGRFDMDLVRLAWDAGYHTVGTSLHGVTQLPSSLLPRNSINGSMSWESVSQTLKAVPLTRVKWLVEDVTKNSFRAITGDSMYRTLRDILTNRK
jgi:peptidoglycan/xylan/chitin deacetylase (PgdA/CDA1 family)